MGTKTGIEWTDATWNPLRGCSRVSEGCRNCYAEAFAYRLSGEGKPYAGLAVLKNGHASWTGKVELVEKHLLDPLKWRPGIATGHSNGEVGGKLYREFRPRRIFVNSMSDLFHESVPDEWLDRIFAVMALCPDHTFQVLTKRPARMLLYLTNNEVEMRVFRAKAAIWQAGDRHGSSEGLPRMSGMTDMMLPNVWLGVSVENQAAADERIPLLLETPAAVRFISAEPLLGELDLYAIERQPSDEDRQMPGFDKCGAFYLDALWGCNGVVATDCSTVYEEARGAQPHLDWVICGGESGPGARPMHQDWARSLRDQCAAAGVPFFFKQWGNWDTHSTPPQWWIEKARGACNWFEWPDGTWSHNWGKKLAGTLLDGVEHKAFPAVRA